MLRREGLRLISHCCHPLWINLDSMASTKQLPSANFYGLSPLNHSNEWCRHRRKICLDATTTAFPANCSLVLRLRSCLDPQDGVLRRRLDDETGKARAMVPHHQPVRDSEIFLREEMSENFINGYGVCKHGSPLGFPNNPMPEKTVIAVDVDEVLGSFLSALNRFIADRYSLNHSVSEYYVYEFFKIWNCSRAEADIRVHEFFKTDYFKSGIHPIPGAWHTLHKLSSFCKLSVVTSRQNVIKDHTLEWIEKHYKGLFNDIHFGNHFALKGQSRPKSEICRSLGAQVLIDDNPRYALECAEIGIKVLLFDYHNSYPWCKNVEADSHPLVTKVHNWHEVERHLFSWIPL